MEVASMTANHWLMLTVGSGSLCLHTSSLVSQCGEALTHDFPLQPSGADTRANPLLNNPVENRLGSEKLRNMKVIEATG